MADLEVVTKTGVGGGRCHAAANLSSVGCGRGEVGIECHDLLVFG